MLISLEPVDWEKPIVFVNPFIRDGGTNNVRVLPCRVVTTKLKDTSTKDGTRDFCVGVVVTTIDDKEEFIKTDIDGYANFTTTPSSILRAIWNYLEDKQPSLFDKTEGLGEF